jgi:hypothetical protein
MKCSKTPALMSGRCAIESNEEAGEVRIGAARWSTVTWWQFEQATVAKSRPLRAVSAEFTICPQAGPAIAKMESVASNAKAHSIARAFVWNGWIIVSPWVRSLRKINAHGRSRISYLKHDNCRFSVPHYERLRVGRATTRFRFRWRSFRRGRPRPSPRAAAPNNQWASFFSHTLLSWKAAPPNGATGSAPVSVLIPRPSG